MILKNIKRRLLRLRRSPSSKHLAQSSSRKRLTSKIKVVEITSGIEGIVEESGESWESTEGKVKEMFTEKLQMDIRPAIDRAHRTGKGKKPDGTPKPRTVVCKLYDWKEREAILEAAKRIKPQESIFMKILLRRQWRSKENFFQN